ncbi:MAG: hypothetical protein KAI67_05080 [Candidatus Pacebacteria bacterium]|nr:hypothetical protein [Candidatus Paceibacterota bacterium]
MRIERPTANKLLVFSNVKRMPETFRTLRKDGWIIEHFTIAKIPDSENTTNIPIEKSE